MELPRIYHVRQNDKSPLQKRQQFGVDRLSLRCGHAVREVLVGSAVGTLLQFRAVGQRSVLQFVTDDRFGSKGEILALSTGSLLCPR